MDGYPAPTTGASGELKEKGSRFLALVEPARDEAGARRVLDAVRGRYPGATHHCWAWRLGWPPAERSADDGEPAGTAGGPILRILQGSGLSDVVAVVVRWFGGTKLGKGGLARAYSGATRQAIADLATDLRMPTTRLLLKLPYDRVGAVKRLIRPPGVEIVAQDYTETVRLELEVFVREVPRLRAELADLGLEV